MNDVKDPTEQAFSRIIVHLLRGVLYRDTHASLWHELRGARGRVTDHLRVMGLRVEIDDAEGYAYLRSLDTDDELPRLIPRRPLGYQVSLLLALLRKRLAEHDAQGGDTRLIISHDQLVEMLRVYLPTGTNEAALITRIDRLISQVKDLGFMRELPSGRDLEVRRILKAYVDGQWLSDFEAKLAEYVAASDQNGEPRAEGVTA